MPQSSVFKPAILPLKITNTPMAGQAAAMPQQAPPAISFSPGVSAKKNLSGPVSFPAANTAPQPQAFPQNIPSAPSGGKIIVPENIKKIRGAVENLKKRLMESPLKLFSFGRGKKASVKNAKNNPDKRQESKIDDVDGYVDNLLAAGAKNLERIMQAPSGVGDAARRAFKYTNPGSQWNANFSSGVARVAQNISRGEGGVFGNLLQQASQVYQPKKVKSVGDFFYNAGHGLRDITVGDWARSVASAVNLTDEIRRAEDSKAALTTAAAFQNIFKPTGADANQADRGAYRNAAIERARLLGNYAEDLNQRLNTEQGWLALQTLLMAPVAGVAGAGSKSLLKLPVKETLSKSTGANILSKFKNFASLRNSGAKAVVPAAENAAAAAGSAAKIPLAQRVAALAERARQAPKITAGRVRSSVSRYAPVLADRINQAPKALAGSIARAPGELGKMLAHPAAYETALAVMDAESLIRGYSPSAQRSEKKWNDEYATTAPGMADFYQSLNAVGPEALRSSFVENFGSDIYAGHQGRSLEGDVSLYNATKEKIPVSAGAGFGLGSALSSLLHSPRGFKNALLPAAILGVASGRAESSSSPELSWDKILQAVPAAGASPENFQRAKAYLQYLNTLSTEQLADIYRDLQREKYLDAIILHNPSAYPALYKVLTQE